MTKILLVGYGRMGKLVESLAGEYGCEIAGIVDPLVSADGVDSDRWAGRGCRGRFLVAGCGDDERAGAGPATHQRRRRHDRMGLARSGAAQNRRRCRHRHRRRAEFLDRRRHLRSGRRPRPRACLRRKRSSAPFFTKRTITPRRTRRPEPRCAQTRDGTGRFLAADRRLLDPGRIYSRGAHGRLRRSRRDDDADPHRPGPDGIRAWSPGGRTMGQRAARLVHNAGCAGARRTEGTGWQGKGRIKP